MKSILIWIGCVAVGALAGYGFSFILEMHIYLLIAIGVIIGSSIGVTWNVHREKEEDFEDIEIQDPISDEEAASNQEREDNKPTQSTS